MVQQAISDKCQVFPGMSPGGNQMRLGQRGWALGTPSVPQPELGVGGIPCLRAVGLKGQRGRAQRGRAP